MIGMNDNKDYFLGLAYSLYPHGISDEDAEIYRQTIEFSKMMQLLHEHKYLDSKWYSFLEALQKRFQCIDIGIPDQLIRGYRIAIVLAHPKQHYIVVNISKLVPYYCFYTKSELDNVTFNQPGYFIFSNFIKSDQEVVSWVSAQIKIYFDGYEEFPGTLPLVQLENVQFDECGILLSDKYRLYPKPMTLFNAFFSTNMFY